MMASGRGGQPGMYTSTGRTRSTPPALAYPSPTMPPEAAQGAHGDHDAGLGNGFDRAADGGLQVDGVGSDRPRG